MSVRAKSLAARPIDPPLTEPNFGRFDEFHDPTALARFCSACPASKTRFVSHGAAAAPELSEPDTTDQLGG
jgi:hypothetical protein